MTSSSSDSLWNAHAAAIITQLINNYWSCHQSQLCFTIGSVESFERSLEAVQQEMNIDPAFWIPVTYVKESEWL